MDGRADKSSKSSAEAGFMVEVLPVFTDPPIYRTTNFHRVAREDSRGVEFKVHATTTAYKRTTESSERRNARRVVKRNSTSWWTRDGI